MPFTANHVAGWDFSGGVSVVSTDAFGITSVTDASGGGNTLTNTVDATKMAQEYDDNLPPERATLGRQMGNSVSSDNLVIPTAFSNWSDEGQPPFHYLMVFQIVTLPSAQANMIYFREGATHVWGVYLEADGSITVQYPDGGGASSAQTLGSTYNTDNGMFHLLSYSCDSGGNISFQLDDDTPITANDAADSGSELASGRALGVANNGADYRFGEVHFFKDELTAGEYAEWRNYLRRKWTAPKMRAIPNYAIDATLIGGTTYTWTSFVVPSDARGAIDIWIQIGGKSADSPDYDPNDLIPSSITWGAYSGPVEIMEYVHTLEDYEDWVRSHRIMALQNVAAGTNDLTITWAVDVSVIITAFVMENVLPGIAQTTTAESYGPSLSLSMTPTEDDSAIIISRYTGPDETEFLSNTSGSVDPSADNFTYGGVWHYSTKIAAVDYINHMNSTRLQRAGIIDIPFDNGPPIEQTIASMVALEYVSEHFHVTFNGSDEYLLANTSTLGIADQWSLFFVVSFADLSTGSTQRPFDIIGAANANNIRVGFDGSGNVTIVIFDSAGSVFKNFAASSATLGVSDGVAFTLGLSYDGSSAGDPLLVYIDGSDITASMTKSTDTTGTMTDSSRQVSVGAATSGSLFAGIDFQSLHVHASVLSAANFSTLHSQVNDTYPVSGFTPVHRWTASGLTDSTVVEDSGSASAIDLMANAVGITAASNRVFGNLI